MIQLAPTFTPNNQITYILVVYPVTARSAANFEYSYDHVTHPLRDPQVPQVFSCELCQYLMPYLHPE
jgi:hypothetical protein